MEAVDYLISWNGKESIQEICDEKLAKCKGRAAYLINDGRNISLFALMREGVIVDDILGVSFNTTGSLKLNENYYKQWK